MADSKSADNVHWHVTMTVNAGKADAVKPLINRMVASTEANEPGALTYDYMGEGDQVHICERYANNAAAMTHVRNLGENFAGEFLATFTITSFVVYGPAGDDLREGLALFSPAYFPRIAGFSR
jgi:hypothetical protein